jgi:spore germination cell wall hydrolase CwlJ-like protein
MKQIIKHKSIIPLAILAGLVVSLNTCHPTPGDYAPAAISQTLQIPPQPTPQSTDVKTKVRVYYETNQTEVNMNSDIGCASANNFFEAASESFEGKVAISHVVLKRSKIWGNSSVCDAVTNAKYNQYGMIKANMCHFSWYCDPNQDAIRVIKNTVKDNEAFYYSYLAAKQVFEDKKINPKYKEFDHYCTLKSEKEYYARVKKGDHRKIGSWWIGLMKPKSRTVIGTHVFFEHDPAKFNQASAKTTKA